MPDWFLVNKIFFTSLPLALPESSFLEYLLKHGKLSLEIVAYLHKFNTTISKTFVETGAPWRWGDGVQSADRARAESELG